MKRLILLFAFFLTLCTVPASAQTNQALRAPADTTQVLQKGLEAAVAQAQRKSAYSRLDPGILYWAEERLQLDYNAHSGYPKHDLMYYYRQIEAEIDQAAPQKSQPSRSVQPAPAHPQKDPGLLIRAEELLQQDRDAHDGYAVHTLEYYYRLLLTEK